MIGKRLQLLRVQQGLSLTELAERAGVSKSYLSCIERDIRTNPSIHFLEKIAPVLKVSTEVFLSEDPMEEQEFDPEWVQLIKEMMEEGWSKEQIREYFAFFKTLRTKS